MSTISRYNYEKNSTPQHWPNSIVFNSGAITQHVIHPDELNTPVDAIYSNSIPRHIWHFSNIFLHKTEMLQAVRFRLRNHGSLCRLHRTNYLYKLINY